ncbi:hypothetical protein [Streptomyces nodosus]|uniref:hypothetical protein n=1 Tax=Streptomyces nodosus TaxID=40318 RepID=UPI0037FA811E
MAASLIRAGHRLRVWNRSPQPVAAQSAGARTDVPLPFGSVLRDVFLDTLAHGDSHKDWAAITAVSRRRAGLPV